MDTTGLRSLANLILKSLDEIDSITANKPGEFPSLDTPIANPTELQVYDQIKGPATTIRAACGQLAASVAPVSVVTDSAWAFIISSCLKTVGVINVAELLREAGPKGLHVREICKPSGTDPQKIARVLRVLATHHIFQEVTPDVFANNRVSSLLDSGCSIYDLFERPDRKRSDKFRSPGGGCAAFAELMVDDVFTAASKVPEFLTDSKTAMSTEATHAPMNMAFNMQIPVMEWQHLPENELRATRFDNAMVFSVGNDGALRGFDWAAMAPGSKIVDVAGGFGIIGLRILEEHKHLTYIIQDQPGVLVGAKDFWKARNPDALANNRVQFQALNFFDTQPLNDASIYVMRYIVHDWSDPHIVKILSNLRAASQPSTRLVVIDTEIPFACPDIPASGSDIPRKGAPAWLSNAPKPLLANYGMGNTFPYFLDFTMLVWNNSQERTMPGFKHIFHESGWEIEEVFYLPEFGNLQIVCKPI